MLSVQSCQRKHLINMVNIMLIVFKVNRKGIRTMSVTNFMSLVAFYTSWKYQGVHGKRPVTKWMKVFFVTVYSSAPTMRTYIRDNFCVWRFSHLLLVSRDGEMELDKKTILLEENALELLGSKKNVVFFAIWDH